MQVFLVLETCFLLKLHFKQILKHKKNTVKFTRERRAWQYGHFELSLDRYWKLLSASEIWSIWVNMVTMSLVLVFCHRFRQLIRCETFWATTKNHDHWLAEMSGSSIWVYTWSTCNDMIILDFCRAFEKVPFKRV